MERKYFRRSGYKTPCSACSIEVTMNSDNVHELLRGHLEMESREAGFSPLDRVTWLVTRLEDYIARFNGALAIPGWSMEDLKGSDTLRVIQVCAELLDHEMRAAMVPAHVSTAWGEVRACLEGC